jgi:cell division protein FtsZ
VNKAPSAPQPRQPVVSDAPAVEEEKPRFGINSLINRMTGHSQETPAAPAPRQQPNLQAAPAPAPAEEADPEQERIEIPAFLRRQAN